MYLLLGDPRDPCCQEVGAALEARGCATRTTANPLAHPSCLAWQLDNERSASRLGCDGQPAVPDWDIAGVLVRGMGWIDPDGWQPEDLAYVQTETQAALLAWLWSLACPVINRYTAALWYRPRAPLLAWHRLLRLCGLPTLETLVTNAEPAARAFGRRLAEEGTAGAVYGPLTSDARYLVAGDEGWSGLAVLQRLAPVCLTVPHGAAQPVCVVGERVVWEGEPSPEAIRLEPALRRFATMAGLTFVELAVAAAAERTCVVAVAPHPRLEHFSGPARRWIVEGIVDLLMAGEPSCRKNVQILERSLS